MYKSESTQQSLQLTYRNITYRNAWLFSEDTAWMQSHPYHGVVLTANGALQRTMSAWYQSDAWDEVGRMWGHWTNCYWFITVAKIYGDLWKTMVNFLLNMINMCVCVWRVDAGSLIVAFDVGLKMLRATPGSHSHCSELSWNQGQLGFQHFSNETNCCFALGDLNDAKDVLNDSNSFL